jgi:Xaa-Pro aminopeptidase
MFQDFAVRSDPSTGGPRLSALRAVLRERDLDGFLVPRADAHQGEYIAPHDERLPWLTGFTGSAGFCIALEKSAGVFIDGRYRLQVRDQVDLTQFTPVNWPQTKPADWLKQQLPEGGKIGFDPWLHTVAELEKLREELKGSGIELVPSENPVDAIWTGQPEKPDAPMVPHPIEFSGKTHVSKCLELGAELTKAGQRAAVLTLPDSIAWLLNTRGSDIERNPVTLAFAILHDSGKVDLFLNPAKAGDGLRAHLGDKVTIRPEGEFAEALIALDGPVRVDKDSAPAWVSDTLKAAKIEVAYATDPAILPKACKNAVELDGARAAHIRDGAAMAEFLAWLSEEAPKEYLTEIDVVAKLEAFRTATDVLRDISFDTICGAGPNGAIVHYRVTDKTNRSIARGDVLLVDSGGQYRDGTTDITRTVAVGAVPDNAKFTFTLVLKGMIGISSLRFPDGLAGRDIDALARAPLWSAGLDYDHGTGHGVGSYLSVHEGPQRISRQSHQVLKPGMILSNEPGYYREGAFGIRIENLIAVREAPPIEGADDRGMLFFETLTLAPIDRDMIKPELLTASEIRWLDAYHDRVEQALSKLCSPATRDWLHAACKPL